MKKTIDGYTFELISGEDSYYECRGEICYDEDHDQIPEAGLWKAAVKLCDELILQGYKNAEVNHSEKGWVEINLNEH